MPPSMRLRAPGGTPPSTVPGSGTADGAVGDDARTTRGGTGTGPVRFAALWFGLPLAVVLAAAWADLPSRLATWLARLAG